MAERDHGTARWKHGGAETTRRSVEQDVLPLSHRVTQHQPAPGIVLSTHVDEHPLPVGCPVEEQGNALLERPHLSEPLLAEERQRELGALLEEDGDRLPTDVPLEVDRRHVGDVRHSTRRTPSSESATTRTGPL